MNSAQATAAVATALADIAPEVDVGAVDADIRLRDELDLDSLDFLALVQSLHDATGVDIPEADYGRVETLNALISYLVERGPVSV
jgi:acyl carrier protein